MISGLNDDGMIHGILKEMATLEYNEETTSKDVVLWAHSVESQRAQNQPSVTCKKQKTLML